MSFRKKEGKKFSMIVDSMGLSSMRTFRAMLAQGYGTAACWTKWTECSSRL